MNYPCEMIRDLLPLYHDQVCSQESKTAVEAHLAHCQDCRKFHELIRAENAFAPGAADDRQEQQMAESLKKVKLRLNKRTRAILGGSLAAVALVAAGFQLLFNLPLKSLSPKDISVEAQVYPMEQLAQRAGSGDTTVLEFYAEGNSRAQISLGEGDDSQVFGIVLPELGGQAITITGDAAEKCEYVTSVSWSSPYLLREIQYAHPADAEEGTIYVEGFRTTLLNNRAGDYSSTLVGLEMREVEKIVYLDEGGGQQLLWQAGAN